MVGDDGVDGAVKDALDDRLAVLLLAQRRVHAEVGVAASQQLVGHHHVVRRCLAGDPDPSGLGLTDQLNRPFGADVRDVDGGVGTFRQHNLPHGDAVLAGTVHAADAQLLGNLALVDDAAVDDAQILTVADHRHTRAISLL